jgi:C-type mannose receptor
MIYQRLGWDEARAACEKLDAELAVMSDSGDRDFITGRFFGVFWIGANDRNKEDQFQWSDGTPVTYADFAEGEPDNLGGESNCVVVERDLRWHDRHCPQRYRALCQK